VVITLNATDLSTSGRCFADVLLTNGSTQLGTVTFIIDVHSNTVSTNLYVAPYLSGDPTLNIPANTTNRQYTFVEGKEGYIRLQETNTVIDADVTYKFAFL
jgi:hypothetical protein